MDIQTRADLQGEGKRNERARLVRQLIADSFVVADMARESVRDFWDKLSQPKKSEFQGLFSELFQDSYTRMVLNFLQQENIEYRGETQKDKGARVETVIKRASEHIPVNYDLVEKNGRWLIRDVEIDGVGIVENYRSTFGRAIKAKSFDSLLEKMRLQSQAIKKGEG